MPSQMALLLLQAARFFGHPLGESFGSVPNRAGTEQILAQLRQGFAARPEMSRSPVLLRKETICDENGRAEPVRRLVFADGLDVNTALRQVVLVHGRMYSATPQRPDGTFDLIVRVYRSGNVSRWLDGLQLGASVNMKAFPPTVPVDRRNPGRLVGLVAYGIGITELYWTAKAELQDPAVERVVLLYATRTMEDQKVFGPELEELRRDPRFRLERVLSRECSPGVRTGRVDMEMLKEIFPWENVRSEARFVAAGTKEMMETTYSWLRRLGYPDSCKLIRDLTFSSLLGR